MRCKLSIILFVLLISACTPSPPDVPVCANLTQHLGTDPVSGHLILKASPTCMAQIGEVECGHCTYVISGKEIFVGELPTHLLNGKTWSKIKTQSILLPAVESYAPLATYVIDACQKMNCSSQVAGFKIKLDSLNGISALLQNP